MFQGVVLHNLGERVMDTYFSYGQVFDILNIFFDGHHSLITCYLSSVPNLTTLFFFVGLLDNLHFCGGKTSGNLVLSQKRFPFIGNIMEL